jgi:hypothetical protein
VPVVGAGNRQFLHFLLPGAFTKGIYQERYQEMFCRRALLRKLESRRKYSNGP